MDFSGFVREYGEPLQYAAFFGALAGLGAWEALQARRRGDAGGCAPGRRWPVNGALTALNILVLGALPVSAVAAAEFAASRGWGLLNQPLVPPLAAFALGFGLRSLVGYFIHVAMHKVPVLWRVHRVHHTDTGMDVSTTVRFHPLEFAIALPIQLAAVIVLGLPPVALILYEIADAAIAVFTHADIRLPVKADRVLRLVLVTPAMHRIHHSTRPAETDSNYGALFSWWDRLFGTHRVAPEGGTAALRVGLDDADRPRAQSIGWLLAMPFLGARRLRGAGGGA